MTEPAMSTARPRFKRHFRVETIDGEAGYLVSERDLLVLPGPAAQLLAPLLDGQRDLDDVITAVDGRLAPEKAIYFVDELVRRGQAIWADPAAEPRAAAFWDMAGLDGDRAVHAVRTMPVRLDVLGDAAATECADALARAGIEVAAAGQAGLTVVITDDYLRPELAAINERQLKMGTPWLLAKPTGSLLWVGPVFEPGAGPCWECLAHRLRGHRPAVSYLELRLGLKGPLRGPDADLAVTRQIGMSLAAAEAAKWLAGARPASPGVLTFDTIGLEAVTHALHRRGQCPACGDPRLVEELMSRPVVLQPRPRAFTGDGGHRAAHPEDLLERYQHLVSPVTGVVRELRKAFGTGGSAGGDEFVKCYLAGHNFAKRATDLGSLRSGMRSQSSGKGMTDVQARASAMGEAIERHCGMYQGDEPKIKASFDQLGADAIAPNACQLYSDRQYRRRAETNKGSHSFAFVGDPLDPGQALDWSPVWSLTAQRSKYLPTAYLFYGYPLAEGQVYAWADSNGNAAGISLEDAILQGFLELVERESVAYWWYHRLRRPAIDLGSFGDSWIDRCQEFYAARNREIWAMDLTADFGIPAVVAVSRRIDKPAEDILMAFGAHYDPQIAVRRAMTELNQFITAVIDVKADGTGYAYQDEFQLAWWRSATVAEHGFLLPDPAQRARTPADFTDLSGGDLLADVLTAQRLVEERGMELLVLDQTRPDIGLPVVKVIVPGMRHFWTRFGPGRLYEVPVSLGWLQASTPEPELNPIPMFL
jgi:ribosomal protein S12 methylthiotransferase accessory factor